jgi:hypothetical protein
MEKHDYSFKVSGRARILSVLRISARRRGTS